MNAPSTYHHPQTLTAGAFGLRNGEIADSMSVHFSVHRTTFRNGPAWRLEQHGGPELLPFAVHHRRARQAVSYAEALADGIRCVVTLEGRHRVVRPAKLQLGRRGQAPSA